MSSNLTFFVLNMAMKRPHSTKVKVLAWLLVLPSTPGYPLVCLNGLAMSGLILLGLEPTLGRYLVWWVRIVVSFSAC